MDEAQIRVEWRKQGQPSAEKLRLALRQKAAQGGPAAPTLAAVREAIARDSTRQIVAKKKTGAGSSGAITARAPDEIWQAVVSKGQDAMCFQCRADLGADDTLCGMCCEACGKVKTKDKALQT